MKTIQEVYDGFIEKYTDCNNLLANSTILYQNKVQHNGCIYNFKMHSAIVEHCFMQIFLAWEFFLEKSFLLYLNNACDMKGETYVRYGLPVDNEHAYSMVKGMKQYPDWTNLNEINTLSNIYFKDSGPYNLLTSNPVELAHIKTIRNKISHVSEKSTRTFNSLLVQTITRSTNVSVCDFLISFKNGSETYYTYYTYILKSYVEAICNK